MSALEHGANRLGMNISQRGNSDNLLLIGIDDTDNLDTRGTGFRARQLAKGLQASALATTACITRHQLLVDPRIPYTSHNSSACLRVIPRGQPEAIREFCREYLLGQSALGADAGLCLASTAAARAVIEFGLTAQREVLDQDAARKAARTAGIYLEGLTGTRGGIIGALAGVGLHEQGDDGRYIWVRRIRELDDACMTIAELVETTGIERVLEIDGLDVTAQKQARIALGRWARPVRIGGYAVLLVERSTDDSADFVVAAKQRIKDFEA